MARFCEDCPCFCPPDLDNTMGNCRASPPTVLRFDQTNNNLTSAWPPVRPDNWCWKGRLLMQWWIRWLL